MTDPTANDCCRGCRVYTDDFSDGSLGDFEEEFGTWEDESGASPLATSDNDAAIIYRTSIIEPVNLWRLEAGLLVTFTDSVANKAGWRLIFYWTDIDNFWYVEFEEETVASLVTGTTIRIVEVDSGTPTVWREHFRSSGGAIGHHANAGGVCFQNGRVHAYIVGEESTAVTHDIGTGLAGEFGLGTGVTDNVNEIKFDAFELSIDSTGEGNCDDCPTAFECDDGCTDDHEPPVAFQVAISGVINRDVFLVYCTECDNVNGTHVLTAGGVCFWHGSIDDLGTAGPGGNAAICEDWWRILLTVSDIGGGNYRLEVRVEANSSSQTAALWQLDQAGKFNCADIDELDLPYIGGGACGPDNPPISNPAPICLVTAL